MKIDGNTKVSKVIKENREAIEAIASLNPYLRIFKIPFFRWIIAPFMVLSDITKDGKPNLQKLFDELEIIGFEIEKEPVEIAKRLTTLTVKLDFIGESTISVLNMRRFSYKKDTISNIPGLFQSKMKKLRDNEVLKTLVDYESYSLIKDIENKGYKTLTIFEDGIYQIYLKNDLAIKVGKQRYLNPEKQILVGS